jgi:HD-like signal output (HDOD) protein
MATVNPVQPMLLQSLITRTEAVYSLPLFYERLTEVINHPRSSIADLTRVVSEDQGLTARLLKLANSPMFGYFSKIDSIGMAATIIGTQQLQALALAVSVIEVFTGIPKELIDMKSFWKHSIACGIIARALASYHREINVERVFAAGILHDVGRLAMCSTIPGIVIDLLVKSHEEESLLFHMEQDRLEFTHAAAGGGLLTKWRIPASIAEPVNCHHAPGTAEKFPLEAALVHLADIICHSLAMGFSGEMFVPPLDVSAWKRLDIPAGSLAMIVKQVEPQLAETMAILGESAL